MKNQRTFLFRTLSVCMLAGLSACGTPGPGAIVPSTNVLAPTRSVNSRLFASPPGSSPQYILTQSVLPLVSADSVASADLNGKHPYIALDHASPPYPAGPMAPTAWGAIYVARWGSEAQMAKDMPSVPSWVTVCMYDNEPSANPPTPYKELAHPATYVTAAATVCHNAGKTFILTASLRGNAAQRQIVINTAGAWDGYAMQTQTSLFDIVEFDELIAMYQTSILLVNPNVKLIAGVGDFANGTLAPLSQTEAAARTVPAGMAIWLNFGPHAGSSCKDPNVCPLPARTDLEIQFLKDFGP